ncbi:MAG: DMT family transporter [Firmicutes bacterium]|uniref:EamA family transporter n=1 Tax=Sulfobacillus benefaciens TaxID=453960 RepID=A0A2T2WVR5_9FIRM|nr:DMT family transporter [Bacillota bacterium]MCL5013341.1 DMT family transporter [Bacillota bacterium]PSR26328.1 MAG: EamA family transporter [Sulfobacillus benefaciens]
MNAKDIAVLVLLAALWGGSFLFMRVASPVLGPVVLIDLRVLIAGFTLLLYARALHHRVRLLHKWKEYFLLGSLNAAIPFCLIASAELILPASWAAILNAVTPLFTAIVAYGWVKEPVTKRKLIGLVLGVIGVAVLVGWNSQPVNERVILAVFFSLTAALFYGIGGVYTRVGFPGEKPLDLAIGQQLAAGVILIPLALFFVPHQMPGSAVIWSVIGLALLSTSLAYPLYFRLIRSVGPVKTLEVTFLVPVFGVFWGWLILREAVSAGTFFGLVVILLSVAFVTGAGTKTRVVRQRM